MSGARSLAVGASAAGVLLVTAGVAILVGSGGQTPHTHGAAGAARVVRSVAAPTVAVAGPAANTAAYPPAYPPHNPCTLTFVRAGSSTGDSSGDGSAGTSGSSGTDDTTASQSATVEGDGLGPAQTVTVDYYPESGSDATVLGSWRTDQSGAFTASVDVPASGSAAAYVAARSPQALCTTPAGPNDPGYPPSTSSPAPPRTSGPAPTSAPVSSTGNGSGTNGATPPGTGSSGAPGSGGSGGGPSGGTSSHGASSGGASSGGASSGGVSGSTTSGGGTTGATSSQGAGANSSTSSPSSGTGSSRPTVSPSPTTTPAAIGAQNWGLPISFIVTMALVLLLLGGLAVLVLTRRSG